MKQLIIKEFTVQRKALIWYIIYPLLFYVITQDSRSVFAIITVVIPIMIMMKTFHSDDKNGSEKILNSLPITKKQIVLAKYVFALLTLVVSVIISSVIVGIQFRVEAIEFIKTTVVSSVSITLLYLSLVIPIYFTLGYQRTMFITMLILIVPIFILESFFKGIMEQIILQFSDLLLIFSVCMLFVSMMVCIKLYERREL